MKILITESGYIPESNETPIPGHHYVLIDAEEYTKSMRNLWEALVDEWHKSGLYSFVDSVDKWKFREEVKLRYGEGFDKLKYVADDLSMVEVKTAAEIPDEVTLDFANGNVKRILGVVKSSTKYTKRQFMHMIDKTLDAMIEAGVDSDKFRDIVEALNEYRTG